MTKEGWTPGELIERVDGDVTTLSNFFSAFVVQVVGNLILVTSIVALMWREHPLIGLGMTIFSVVAMAFMVKIQAIAIPWWREVRGKRAAFFGFRNTTMSPRAGSEAKMRPENRRGENGSE